MTILLALSLLTTFNGGELVFWARYSPASRMNPGMSTLEEGPELAQSGILSGCALGLCAERTKVTKRLFSRLLSTRNSTEDGIGPSPDYSTSSVIIGAFYLALSDQSVFPHYARAKNPEKTLLPS